MAQDQRGCGDSPALVDGRGDGPEQDAVQHGGDLLRVRSGDADERVERADARGGQAGDDPGEQSQRGPGVVRLQEERHEHERRGRGGPLQDRHFQDQAAHPLGCPHRGEQAHVGPQRYPAEHRLLDGEFVQQAQNLVGVEIHPVGAGVARPVAPAVTQQVEQHDTVALGGQPPGQIAAELGVQQQAVQPQQHPVSGTVDLIGQLVLTIGEGVPRTVRAGAGQALHNPSAGSIAPGRPTG